MDARSKRIGMKIRQTYSDAVARLHAAGVPEAEIEARLLIQHAAGLDTTAFLTSLDSHFPECRRRTLAELLRRRARREPLAYLIGHKEFFGRDFDVDNRVLIPRPETELLVELAIEFAMSLGGVIVRIVDIGTGSGVLAVTLAAELPDAEVAAIDIDEDALAVARRNAEKLGVGDRVAFVHADFNDLSGDRFAIVVSNPPYIRSGALQNLEPELSFEPVQALDGGENGTAVLNPLIDSLPELLSPGRSAAFIEIDPPIAIDSARRAAKVLPGSRIEIVTDLAGLDRCLAIYMEAGNGP